MRRLASVMVALALVAVGVGSADAKAARVGVQAPRFRIDALNGGNIDLARYRGKPVFLNFFATWCAPCKLELPYIVKAYPNYRGRVAFVGIDELDSPVEVKTFVKRMGMGYTIGIDQGEAAAEYLDGSIPVSVFIDSKGVIRAVNRGYLTPQRLLQDLGLIAGH
jgi:cytochrome c biogenesis protein CcmG/thiol:disulfide interchange protein DsbE